MQRYSQLVEMHLLIKVTVYRLTVCFVFLLCSWTSHASADLILLLSQLSSPEWQQISESFCVGPREVGCILTFLTIRPLLFAWKQLNLPIFIVLKTITELGYTVQ